MEEPPSPGLTVIEVVPGKRRMRLVRLSDGREFVFSEEACTRRAIEPGKVVTAAILAELEDDERRVQAHEAALRMLSHRSRAESEMRTRLRMRGIEPEIVEEEIQRLRAAGLIDDDRFAESWVADRQRMSPRGRRMLRYELLGRGISPDAVDRATASIDDLEVALEAARSRARKAADPDYESFATRVGGYLQRRGFSYDVVMEAIRTAWRELGQANPDAAFAERAP